MPTVKGSFGEKPTISTPSTPPPDTLQRVVLSKGAGPVTAAGDWLQVNYLGQVWGGKVFDNSFDRGQVFTVQVGGAQKMVVDGWDVGLQGVTQGSRVLLSFPPQDGYGSAGKAPDIGGDDTLIFVVDVVKVFPADAGGDPDAVVQQTPSGLPKVSGALGSEPKITVPNNLTEPTKTSVTVLAKGSGAPVKAGDVVMQYVATSWDGTKTEKSWPDPSGTDATAGDGPRSFPISADSAFAPLIGIPIGSRVLMTMAADSSNGLPALAWVMDLIVQQDVATPAPSSGATTSGGAAPTESAPPTS
jgi:peptidylprolyl isomerase